MSRLASGRRASGVRALVVAAVSGIGSGCSVELLDAPMAAANTCTDSTECGVGGICTDGACVAKQGTLNDLLLEVVPDTSIVLSQDYSFASIAGRSGLSFLLPQSDLATGDRARNVPIPKVGEFVGQVQSAQEMVHDSACWTFGLNVPAQVTFTRTGVLDGLPLPGMAPFVIQLDNRTNGDGPRNQRLYFSTAIIPGLYDIYVELPCAEKPAPTLLTGVEISSTIDPMAPPALLALPNPLTLQGQVRAGAVSLAGWEVSLIEPKAGRRISTVAKLGHDAETDFTNFLLSYQPVRAQSPSTIPITSNGTVASSLIRVAPPADQIAPTIYWDLAAANIEGTDKIALDMTGIPSKDSLVHVSGRVYGAGKSAGVASTIWFFSTSLQGSRGLMASFSPYVGTDENGQYSIRLFPGTYRVATVPGATGGSSESGGPLDPIGGNGRWGITEQSDYVVGLESDQMHDIELLPKAMVVGHATLAGTGRAAVGATIVAEAPANQTTVWDGTLLARTAVLPRSSRVSVPESGAFSLELDRSTFDVTVRPPEGSGLAWWVRPSLTVSSENVVALEPSLPLPVPFEGQIRDGERVLSGALIRAYAKAPDGMSVSQVGSTRADSQGRFKLPLPSRFAD